MQDENKEFEHAIGSAIMDTQYNFTVLDEVMYGFLGDKVISLFTAYIHPDDRECFIEAVGNCNAANEVHVIVRVKNFMGEYCSVIIYIRPSKVDPDKFFDLRLYDVVSLVQEYERIEGAYKKVTYIMQLLRPAVSFDYDPNTGKMTVFSDREVMEFEGPIDDFYKFIIDNDMIDSMQVSGLHKLFEDIKKCSVGVSRNLNMSLFSDTKRKHTMSVRTSVIYDKEQVSPSCVVGVMTAEENSGLGVEKIFNNRSNLDPLTGLYNKAAIKEIAIDAINNTDEVITYVMIDLDHFKDVNDTYGHMYGDEVILNAARIIKDIVGKKGYVGRVGGDEFFIVLKGVGSELEELRPVLRAIRAQIEWAYKGRLGGIRLTTSLGCASYPKDADNYDDLFKLADRCLYFAKNRGRDRFIIYVKELHGSLDEIKASGNTLKMERSISDIQRLEFTTDAVTRISEWKADIINSIFNEMLTYFGIDEIMLYDVAAKKAVNYSKPIDDDDDNICYYIDSLKAAFRESNTLYYGDCINFKMPYPDFYEYTVRNQYLSAFIYVIRVKGEINKIAVAYTKNRYEKWSDNAVNYLSIIFRTAGDKVINKL